MGRKTVLTCDRCNFEAGEGSETAPKFLTIQISSASNLLGNIHNRDGYYCSSCIANLKSVIDLAMDHNSTKAAR